MNNDFHEISETLNLAKLYIENLESLKAEICSVEKQVITTFLDTKHNIEETFSKLKNDLCKILENRAKELINKAEYIRDQGVKPLKQCEKVIEKNIENTKKLIDEGSQISHKDQENVISFLEKASILGNLPEVPESKDVPYISFYHESMNESELKSWCSSFGEVFRTAPIQIKNVTAKPGALLIEWQQSYENDDRIKDIQEFKLQRAFGHIFKDKKLLVNFIDCYTGPESQYLLRDIQISQPYSFRVCCKFDGTTEWSPWSVAQVGLTNIPWFTWQQCDKIILSNDDKIVTPQGAVGKEGRVVCSDGPLVALDGCVEFTIIEDDPKSELILALCCKELQEFESLRDVGEDTFMVDNYGKISIGGVEKSTVLSNLTRGLKVCFSLEPINFNKVRVNVDCKDKRVTYDWPIGETSHLYFACQMMSSKWKVMVE